MSVSLLRLEEKKPRLVDQIAQKLSSQRRTEFTRLASPSVIRRGLTGAPQPHDLKVQTLRFHKGEKLLKWGETSENV